MKQEDQENWPLSVRETIEKIADALGETPATWQQRLTNWRREGRDAPLRHHQEEGKRPFYLTSEVSHFIRWRLATRAAVVGKAPQLASVKAVATAQGIVLDWASSAASGRIRLGLKDASTLGAQLLTLATKFEGQVQDE
ncbi:MAG: hypothetical protein KDE69_15820 [Burkholderiaceae bacterium]|nr:hypothetical protein [Burkholderiaceae bacterium]